MDVWEGVGLRGSKPPSGVSPVTTLLFPPRSREIEGWSMGTGHGDGSGAGGWVQTWVPRLSYRVRFPLWKKGRRLQASLWGKRGRIHSVIVTLSCVACGREIIAIVAA